MKKIGFQMLSVVYYHASIILYTHLVFHGIDRIFSLFQILCYNSVISLGTERISFYQKEKLMW